MMRPARQHFIDPTPALLDLYAQELAELVARQGEPRSSVERFRFAQQRRALKRRILGYGHLAHW